MNIKETGYEQRFNTHKTTGKIFNIIYLLKNMSEQPLNPHNYWRIPLTHEKIKNVSKNENIQKTPNLS